MQATEHSWIGSKVLAKPAGSRAMLSHGDERGLAQRAQRGDSDAFDHLVASHLPLVFAMVSEFRSYGLPMDELLSEGMLGLVKAARCFDPERGPRLAGYAAMWIRAYLRTYSLANRRIVRGPSTRNARKVLAGLRKTERALGAAHGERPGADAVASVLGVSASDVEEARAVLGKRDVAYGVGSEGVGVFLASDEPSPEAVVTRADDQRAAAALVHRGLSVLDPRAQRILQQRYLEPKVTSLATLSREFGISRERVRQIESQAKAAVRSAIAAEHRDAGFSKVA